MDERETLLRLCRLHGIAPDYHDIWGNCRQVPESSLRALLGAMGVRADSASAVEDAIRTAEFEERHAVLPPAVVMWQGTAPYSLRLNVPCGSVPSLTWQLIEEGGTRHEGLVAGPGSEVASAPAGEAQGHLARDVMLPAFLPCGYHRLVIHAGDIPLAQALFVVAPRRCYRPPVIEGGRRVWGPSVQLYAVRSAHNWGMGDFTDLAAIVSQWHAFGADIVGLNPLHALFPRSADHASPYGASSRRFLNVLYIDVEAIEDFQECAKARDEVASADFQARLEALRLAELVDYPGVAAAKFAILDRVYAHFRSRHLEAVTARGGKFRDFQTEGGVALRQHALFEALQEHFHGHDPHLWGWAAWPGAYRDRASHEVAEFAASHTERIEFFEYLQWQADLQLGAAARRSLELGQGVGLYQDLAVSIDRGGAEAWADRDLYALPASIGCPPDDFNLHGQDWGLLPLIPERLRAAGYAPFIAALRAGMRHAGALRIDHVMGLARLFWVPRGSRPDEGAYVSYPFEELLGILALESQRNRCMVIGEDLGTVTDEVREAMDRTGILSYRVLYFVRRRSGDFSPPGEYPPDALVTATTHDLPTLAGYWEGRDLILRDEHRLFPSEQIRQTQFSSRIQNRVRLLAAIAREGILEDGAGIDPANPPVMTPRLRLAVQVFLARTPSRVLMVQLEDALGCADQVNLPGTTTEYPNWRRKLPLVLERWQEDPSVLELTGMLARLRPRA